MCISRTACGHYRDRAQLAVKNISCIFIFHPFILCPLSVDCVYCTCVHTTYICTSYTETMPDKLLERYACRTYCDVVTAEPISTLTCCCSSWNAATPYAVKANAMIARTFRVCKFPSLFFFLSFMARSVMAFAKKYCLFLRALAASRRLWMNAEFGRRGLLKYGPTIEHYTIRDVDIFDADQQLASHIDYVCHIGWDNLRLANGYINGRSIYCYARGIKFTIVVNWKYVNWNRKYFGQRTMDNNASYSYASWTPPHTRSHFDKLCLSFALLPPKCFS